MTHVEAARLLELPDHATSDQIEARFNELRARLEDKIARAPTPGLKAKYRENLDQITAAFETLALAADSSALPVLTKQKTEDGGRKTEVAASTAPREPAPANPKSRSPAQKSSKEFVVVALIAVAVLVGGAWWVMKTRAEKAEQARIAAEAKVEADRKAEQARLAAEAKHRAGEEEKARMAAAAKAEQDRLEKVLAQTSAQLVNLRIGWEAVEQEARRAERRLVELRSDERNQARTSTGPELSRLRAEIAAQAAFSGWLESQLGRHEAKVLRAQAEAMISVRQLDDAARIAAQAAAAQQALDRDITAARTEMLTLTGALSVEIKPAEAEWVLTDAYGAKHTGKGARQFQELPLGPLVIETALPGYRTKRLEAELSRGRSGILAHEFKPAIVRVDSVPQGAEVSIGGKSFGSTPVAIEWPGEGELSLTLKLRGYLPAPQTVELVSGKTVDAGPISLQPYPRKVTRPDFDRGPLRYIATHHRKIDSRTSDQAIASKSSTELRMEHQVEITSPTNSSADASRVRFTTYGHSLDGKPLVTAGTIQDYSKVKEGWLMTYVLGGFADPAMRPHQKNTVLKMSPVRRRAFVDTAAWWPTEGKFPEDTWDVPLTALKDSGVVTLWDHDQKGTITGKVITVRRVDGRDVAEVEFAIDVSSTFVTAEATQRTHAVGRLTCTVDLTLNYVSAESHAIEETTNMELKGFADFKRVTTATNVGNVTVRPL